MGCAKRINRPVIELSVCDKCPDTDDGVVDVFWKFIADCFTDFSVSLAGQVVRGCEPLKIRNRFEVPNDELAFMAPRSTECSSPRFICGY